MKKLLTIALLLAICLSMLSACSTVEYENESDTSMFVLVERASNWGVVYHRETKVMYAVSNGGYNAGTFVLLVNADGSPMLWGD